MTDAEKLAQARVALRRIILMTTGKTSAGEAAQYMPWSELEIRSVADVAQEGLGDDQ